MDRPPTRPRPGRQEPAQGFWRWLDAFFRAALPPVATALLLVFVAAFRGAPALVPAVVLPAVFFWSIFRPLSMSPVAVFALGLLQDLVTYAPIGIGILTLLAVHGLAFRWRRSLAGWSFLAVWVVFCGFAAGAAGLGWLLHALLALSLPPPEPSVQFALLAAGLYPSLAFLMTRAHRAMRQAELEA
ncbi:rod shape-determining protein MreD [Plastoroseomonas arctica]|uniref:Rod shape-determining protein MreD n=1 Tax=Plastoroseomonas arctica TaxID=1509237 RepID=A0AAF1JYT5_9PROT|nr:rod shape-determining protein MreD [Plastoroseomonas arctica]MBR0656962.1 rod shape-determining protein MreD [Plastoroseomonas arctica]